MTHQPKSYKKFVATAATATLVASAIVPVASAAETKDFTDVSSNYKAAVDYLVANGIAKGTSDTAFGTTASITRGDAAVMIANALGLNTASAKDAGFTDVNNRVKASVNAIVEAGIASGKNSKSFAPDDNITRQEMAKMITNAYDLTSTTTAPFSDVNKNWIGYVSALYENKITTGKTATTFNPAEDITRGEFAIFVHRVETTLSAKVMSVAKTTAQRIEVKFNKAIDPTTLFVNGEDGAFVAGTIAFTEMLNAPAVGGLTGELSANGKVLTISVATDAVGSYTVVIKDLETTAGEEVDLYKEIHTFEKDSTAPTIVSVTKPTAGTVKVTFSEPMNSLGNVTFKKADGTAVTAGGNGVTTSAFAPGDNEVTFTLGSDIDANETITATFVGAQDLGLNLINPHPATVNLYKGASDGVAPTVASVSQVNATQFAVKFSEELTGNPTILLSGYTVDSIKKDSGDSTRYLVTTTSPLNGAATLSVSAYVDLSGMAGAVYTKVVTFVKDEVAPKVTKSAVVVNTSDNKEYLELTFDKPVLLDTTPTVDVTSGSHVKDFVTTSIADGDITPKAITYKDANNKSVLRVALSTLLTGLDVENAVYTLNLAFADVTSSALIDADTTKVEFKRGKDGSAANLDKVVVDDVAQDAADNNKINVTFDREVDGASATSVGNYNVAGLVVEKVTLNPVNGGKQVAVLHVKAGTNQYTGVRNISITNVKAKGSTKVMDPYFANNISIKENVAPTVTSAKLTAVDKIELTFSEAVTSAAGLDFEILVGGKARATVETVSVTEVAPVTKVTLSIAAVTVEELAKGISIKALTTLDIEDSVGNTLSVPSNINVVQ